MFCGFRPQPKLSLAQACHTFARSPGQTATTSSTTTSPTSLRHSPMLRLRVCSCRDDLASNGHARPPRAGALQLSGERGTGESSESVGESKSVGESSESLRERRIVARMMVCRVVRVDVCAQSRDGRVCLWPAPLGAATGTTRPSRQLLTPDPFIFLTHLNFHDGACRVRIARPRPDRAVRGR